jgi:hypothetical protein
MYREQLLRVTPQRVQHARASRPAKLIQLEARRKARAEQRRPPRQTAA